MQGTNTFVLNHATMCSAVQYWLNDEVLQNNEKVESVKYNTSNGAFDVVINSGEVTK